MNDIKITPLTYSIHREDENPVLGESATYVSVDDEAGGPFIEIKQTHDHIEPGEVHLSIEELELVTKVARKLIKTFNENFKD